MLTLISKPKINFEMLESDSIHLGKIVKSLSDLEEFYPGFKEWVCFKFRRGLYLNERRIVLACCDNEIAGLALLKDTACEKKVCTFFVSPAFREQSVGSLLMLKSLDVLGPGLINITVSEERNLELSRILISNNFSLHDVVKGLYRDDKAEFIYVR